MLKLFSISIFAVLLSSTLVAQISSGKLAGQIVDADTGEPLIGSNVVILNTSLGAACDIKGNYFILNITPGTYDVQISFVGYSSKLIKDVRVVGGITYELDENLSPGIDLDEIVVTDEKFFEKNSTNTVKVIDSETIARLPLRGVTNIISTQAGVVKRDGAGGAFENAERDEGGSSGPAGNEGINVRGGRAGEVVYIVDNIIQNDQMFGTNQSQVSNAAIDQISFQVGGFEAKYGQAQSGIVNVTTKSGSPKYNLFGDMLTSSFTDDYGYNLYTATVGGPIIPGNKDMTFFLSAERGWFKDGEPSANPIVFESIGYESSTKENNQDAVWRFSAKTFFNLGSGFNLHVGANYNNYKLRLYDYNFAKNNSQHNPIQLKDNRGINVKLSQNISANSFWNFIAGYQRYTREEGDGVFFDDWEAYGDTLLNPYIPSQGNQKQLREDDAGIFTQYGYTSSIYRRTDNDKFTGDFNFTSQIGDHLVEAGIGINYGTLRYYSIQPIHLAENNADYINSRGDTVYAKSKEDRYDRARIYRYGFDLYGVKNGTAGEQLDAKNPLLGYLYLQDRFELEDIILNLGLRVDYFDSQTDIIKDPANPYSGGSDPDDYDPGDFKRKDSELLFSPRIGIGFPVTETTVFHAQYGRFVQTPSLWDLYPVQRQLDFLKQGDVEWLATGYIESEITTQYEVGFRQVIGNVASLNITAFYKNTKDLANDRVQYFYNEPGGQRFQYTTPMNKSFGTIKGLAFSLNVSRTSYMSLSLDYTYSIAEGTGSSTESDFGPKYLTVNNYPKVITPLDFDQRHTLVFILDIYVPKGNLGWAEMLGASFIISSASGRPYSPLESQNITGDSGDPTGYINSKFGPNTFRVDFKLEKSFQIGRSILITPYVWIENLFDNVNEVRVWESTGSAYTTNYLTTDEGKKVSRGNGSDWTNDYKSLERDPSNFGIPRLIRLGLKVNFTSQ